MSLFFKSLGGLLLIRACYSAKRKEYCSPDSCMRPSTAVLELLQLLLSWDLPDTANPVLFRLHGVLAAGGGGLGAA